MRRKKAVKIALYISAASLLLSETAALPTYATGEIYELTEDEGGREEEEKTEESMEANESVTGDEEKEQESSSAAEEEAGTDGTVEGTNGPENITNEDIGDKEGTEKESVKDMESYEAEDTKEGETKRNKKTVATPAQAEKITEEEGDPVRLQVPQKFDIVLDPWEIDGKGQIYSEEYVIRNTSGEQGTLKMIGIVAEAGEDVNVRSDSADIHEGNDRDICIQMVMNGEDRLTLLPEGADYEIILEADSDVTITFTGEMNENAKDGWRGRDVKIKVIYDWVTEAGEDAAKKNIALKEEGAEKENVPEKDNIVEETDKGLNGEKNEEAEIPSKVTEEETIPGIDTPEEGGREDEIPPNTDIPEENGGEEETPSDPDIGEGDGEDKGETSDTEIPEESESGAGEEANSNTGVVGEGNTVREDSTEEISKEEEDGNKQ